MNVTFDETRIAIKCKDMKIEHSELRWKKVDFM